MKKSTLSVALVIALGSSIVLTSCIGSFNLTNKLLSWNRQISNKFVNELVFVAFWILPVYEISGLADILVLNSIEFWSGSNPVAQGRSIIEGKDGQKFLVDCDATGYTITNQTDGSTFRLDFDADSREWSTRVNGERLVFLTFVDDTHVKLPTADGGEMIVETNAQGLYAYREATGVADLALN